MELTERQTFNYWAKVEKTEGCWTWAGAKTGSPTKGYYGMFSVWPRTALAHRIAYELEYGPIPAGLTIDHLCRTTLCVNPAHLEAVTIAENIRRGGGAIKTHCPQGHPYDVSNTWVDGRGKRYCKTCRIARERKRRAALRAAA